MEKKEKCWKRNTKDFGTEIERLEGNEKAK
jgi:hypothetical protein